MSHLLWRAEALVLVIETRTCSRCGSTYRSPGGLFIRMESQIAGYRRSWLISPKETIITSFLPHEHREVHTPVPACELCFVSVPENQLTFWPEKFQPNIAYSERIRKIEAAAHDRLVNGQAPKTQRQRKAAAKKPLTLADL